jgi:5'-nucleotidase
LVASLTVVGVFTADGKRREEPKVHFWLTLLHNNDGESQLINAGSGDLENFGGAARFTTLVRNLKFAAEHGPRSQALRRGGKRGVIMVSSGDNFLAGPEFNASLEKGIPFFDTILMDEVGYDAIAIGNHEFDFGPDVLADFINGFVSDVPFLSANLDFSGEPDLQDLFNAGRIAKSTVVYVRGERVGIVGATTPALPFISSPRDVVVDPNVVDAIQGQIDQLESMGINKIILISHLQDIDEDQALAPFLSGVDIMVAGGGDELLANPGALLLPDDDPVLDVFGPYPLFATGADSVQIPVVTTTGSYRYVGRLVAGFDKDGNLLRIDPENSGPVRVSGVAPDAVTPDSTVEAQVTAPVVAAVAALAANVIGTSEVDLDGQRSSVRSTETNEGNLLADALLWQAAQLAASFGEPAPDAALQNGGGIRNDSIIPAGNITELDTFDIAPFSNFVTIIPNIPRSQFKEILENAVSRAVTGDTPGGTGRFAQISGFSFVWDATGTAQVLDPDDGSVTTPGTRVQEVVLDDATVIVTGGSVVVGADLTIVTIDFLARGGDQYPYRGAPFTSVGVSYQRALRNYIQGAAGLNGVIGAADYPEGGEGRITRLN